jgi:hypothetical protein
MFADLKHALKRLARSPGFVFAVVAMLAIGLGTTTGVVRATRDALFPALPFPEPERLAVLEELQDGAPFILLPHRFAAYHERAVSFEGMAAERIEEMNLVLDQQPYGASTSWIMPEFFSLFGSTPFLGRLFSSDDHKAGSDGSVVVISNGL